MHGSNILNGILQGILVLELDYCYNSTRTEKTNDELWISATVRYTTNSWSSIRKIFSRNWFSSWTNFVCFCCTQMNQPLTKSHENYHKENLRQALSISYHANIMEMEYRTDNVSHQKSWFYTRARDKTYTMKNESSRRTLKISKIIKKVIF